MTSSSELENLASLSLILGLPLSLRPIAGCLLAVSDELMSEVEDDDEPEPPA